MVERRLTWLAASVLLWGAAIFFKLVSLQVFHHREYSNLARARQEMVIEIPAPRGTIFDRAGQPLAMSVSSQSVYINPLKVPDLGVAAELLALVLHMDRAALYARMQSAYENRRLPVGEAQDRAPNPETCATSNWGGSAWPLKASATIRKARWPRRSWARWISKRRQRRNRKGAGCG
jgi:cell division protein FtsI/penicillin-binding protein 2